MPTTDRHPLGPRPRTTDVEILASGDDGPRRRLPSAPVAVAVALAAVAAGQVAAVLRPQPLPATASVEALPNGYSYATEGDRLLVGFQLRNAGDVGLRVVAIGADLPGLQLVDVAAAGQPFDFAAVGEGAAPLPEFALRGGTVIEVTLVYRVRSCAAVPRDEQLVPVTVIAGRAEGVLPLLLPRAPAAAVDAGPDDEDPWQQVLVRDVCPPPP